MPLRDHLTLSHIVTCAVAVIGICFGVSALYAPLSSLNQKTNDSPQTTEVLGVSNSLSGEELQTEIAYWESLVDKRPTFRDGLLKLAVLYANQEDFQRATTYLKQAQLLDPNNHEVLKLEREFPTP